MIPRSGDLQSSVTTVNGLSFPSYPTGTTIVLRVPSAYTPKIVLLPSFSLCTLGRSAGSGRACCFEGDAAACRGSLNRVGQVVNRSHRRCIRPIHRCTVVWIIDKCLYRFPPIWQRSRDLVKGSSLGIASFLSFGSGRNRLCHQLTSARSWTQMWLKRGDWSVDLRNTSMSRNQQSALGWHHKRTGQKGKQNVSTHRHGSNPPQPT